VLTSSTRPIAAILDDPSSLSQSIAVANPQYGHDTEQMKVLEVATIWACPILE
jgi:hypothetical protein